MSKETAKKQEEVSSEDSGLVLRWGKLITRIAAISATITGAFAALFSSSSVTSGITLTAAGASTLAAAEKIPDPKYIKTKHVPPRTINKKGSKAVLQPDILPKPERISATRPASSAPSLRTSASRPAPSVTRLSSFDRK